MKNFIIGTLFILFLLVNSPFAFATHIVGGELSYQCIGNLRYNVTLSIYTECGSDVILEDTYFIKYFSESLEIPLNQAKSFAVNKFNEEEISFYCSSVSTNCEDGSFRGIKRLDYVGTIDLSGFGRANDWTFYWQKSARSEEITTLLSPENEDYYTEILMNNLDVQCNNSPVLTSNPIISACLAQEVVFSNIVSDPEGDDITFRMATPKSSTEYDIVYREGYDFENFIESDITPSIDPNTGDLTFMPTQEEIGITDVIIEERRNGKLISKITRGIQVTTIDCSNNNPVISNLIGLDTNEITACAGSVIDISFSANDDDGDDLFMALQSGQFTEFSVSKNNSPTPTGNLKWHTLPRDTGTHFITVRVDDGVCPEPGVATKTFKINILSLPSFELGADINTTCHDPVEISPQITGGDGDYDYDWSNGESSGSITVGPGNYHLTVTDGEGCVGKDSISVLASIVPDFHILKRCYGAPAEFLDASLSLNSNIISWEWDFGDGSTSSIQNPTHNYANPGTYDVSLTVTDDAEDACTLTVNKEVTVCEDINFDVVPLDTCSGLATVFDINTSAGPECDIQSFFFDYGDGSGGTTNYHIYESGGEYDITLSIETLAGCQQDISKKITILQSPEVIIDNGDTAYFECDDPIVNLTTTVTPGDGGNISYSWNTGENSPNISIDENGVYRVIVSDDNNCYDEADFHLLDPIIPHFTFEAFCELGDSLHFVEDVFHAYDITSWHWDLGDDSTFAIQSPPPHRYDTLGDYQVKLVVEDENQCKDSITYPVYNTFLEIDEFDVTPNDVTICVRDTVFGFGPSGNHVNSYLWNFKNGLYYYQQNPYNFFTSTGDYNVELEVSYNILTGVNQGCKMSFNESVSVFPELDVEILSTRACKDLPVDFAFERTAGDLDVPIVKAQWDFGNLNGSSEEMTPSYVYESTGLYEITLNIEDDLGCLKEIKKDFKVERVATPDFSSNAIEICANEPINFTTQFRDTLENITHYRWVFGEKDSVEGTWPMPNVTIHTLPRTEENNVQLTVWNEFSNCDRSITKTIDPLELPAVDFHVDTICANEVANFQNMTTSESPVTEYLWIFHDNTTSQLENPSKSYDQAGEYPVTLVAFNELNCTDSITKNIVVKEIPQAAFTTEDEFIEAFVPTQFVNESTGDITEYYWEFGDGNFSTEQNPIHTYDSISVYWISLAATNVYGCSDTVIVRGDLNVHLDLPTAFTPNDDNKNDELGLIHHGIKEVYEYKIYNRWGQLVFDGGNDVTRTWDGTKNGARQDAGVYVAHVKARGAYDIYFNFKKNVSLLR